MRINVYAEELTMEVEVVTKAPDNHPDTAFAGIRMYLKSPDELHADPDDDDRSAITIWVPWTKRGGHRPEAVTAMLRMMADKLDDHFVAPATIAEDADSASQEMTMTDLMNAIDTVGAKFWGVRAYEAAKLDPKLRPR